jgi:chromosome segregation ATPase
VPAYDLTKEQLAVLSSLILGCKQVLEELNTILRKYQNIDEHGKECAATSQKVWSRLRWNQDEIKELRSRITSNATLLNAFNTSTARFDILLLYMICTVLADFIQ